MTTASSPATSSPSTAESPHWRIRAMVEALLDTVEHHRYLLQAMLDARAANAAIRRVWDDARESFVPAVAAMIAAERDSGRAPDGPPTEVIAGMLLEFNDRLLERYTIGGTLTRRTVERGRRSRLVAHDLRHRRCSQARTKFRSG